MATAFMLRARTYRLLGRPRRAFVAIQRAGRLARQAGERRLITEVDARFGRLLLDAGRESEAELRLRDALFASKQIEYRHGEALASLFLGTLLAEAGRTEAGAMLAHADRVASTVGLRRVEALSLALRARLAREQGRAEEAFELSLRAVELQRVVGAELSDRIVIGATHALLLDAAGKRSEAREWRRRLERRLRRENGKLTSAILRQRHRRATMELLQSALSPVGPVYPRARGDIVRRS